MNILNVTSIVEWRGGDAQMLTVVDLLKKYDHINQYILCPQNAELVEKAKIKNIDVIVYQKVNKVFSLIKPILNSIKNNEIDILHIHDSSALTAAIFAKILSRRKVALIYSRKRNNPIKNNIFKKWKYHNRQIDQFISVSKAVEQVFKNIHIPSHKLLTIYDAIEVKKFENHQKDKHIFEKFGFQTSHFIIGNVASLTPQKDIATFIKAAKIIYDNNPNCRFIILGKGDQELYLQQLINELNLQNIVKLAGYQPNPEYYLVSFDLFMMSSVTEGLPLTIYEAFAAKVPIVSTKAGGIPEVISNGINGFLVDVGHENDLANKALKCIENEALRKQFVENSFELVKNKFDLKNLEGNYLEFYTNFYKKCKK